MKASKITSNIAKPMIQKAAAKSAKLQARSAGGRLDWRHVRGGVLRRLCQCAMACAIVVVFIGAAPAQQGGMRAKADIKGDNIAGTATLREVEATSAGLTDLKFTTGLKAVEVSIEVSGLTPGAHGIHLHAVGKCEAPGFTTAGGHFDPGPNGNPDPDTNHPFHMGDLPNVIADADGHATYKALTSRVTLADGPLSVFDSDGTAIIIHGNPDQGVTGEAKSGLSGGPRVACGTITKQ